LSRFYKFLLVIIWISSPHGVIAAQDQLDRSDPSIIEEQLTREPTLDRENEDFVLPGATPVFREGNNAFDGLFVGAIRVEGGELPASHYVPVVERYIGRHLLPGEIQSLTTEISEILHDEGYVFATAWVAPQQLNAGMLRVSVDSGRVAEIRYVGNRNSAVERILAPLAGEEPVLASQLERRLLLARDIPGVSISNPSFFREGERGILQIPVIEDRIAGWVELNNSGSESIGPWRAQGGIRVRNIVSDGDQLTLSAIVTPLELGDFQLAGIRYQRPLGSGGTTIAVDGYYATSNPDSVVPGRILEGDSLGASVSLQHPLVRGRDFSLWGRAGIRFRKSMQDQDGLAVRDDQITRLELGMHAYTRLGNSSWSGGFRAIQGIGLFNATSEGDPLASRLDGDARFTKLEFYGRWYKPLVGNFALDIAARGQIASRSLLASEEMGLGGRYFGRGYDYYERSGENGIAGAIEIQYDIRNISQTIENIQFYGFGDAAAVRNNRNGVGGGRLYSAGGGVRVRLTSNFRLSAEAAVPLNQDRFDSGDRSSRLRFSLGFDF
jgi:hemolysin activation/secretion protein